MNPRGWRLFAVGLFGTALILSGCDKGDSDASQAAAQQQIPVVNVLTAKAEKVSTQQNLPGRVEAVREAVIIPRISGIVEHRNFQEGGIVQKGQLLYQLDDGTYRAALMTAQATLKQAEASRDLDQSNVNRYSKLLKSNAVSRQTYDQAVADLRVQEANIAAAKAAIQSAQINLGYTRITAPITGRIGYSQVTEGAYVTASTTQMTTIQQMDPMYVDVTQSVDDFLKLKRAAQNGGGENARQEDITVFLNDGSEYPHKGKFLFVNQVVNENTGEVLVRVQVPNPNDNLLPGMYVRVEVPQVNYPNAYLIPQQAVTRGEENTVIVVNDDGTFHPQPVTIAGQKGSNWIVTGGLKDGDKVLVEGITAIQMGAQKVKAEPWPAPQQAAAPASSAATSDNQE